MSSISYEGQLRIGGIFDDLCLPDLGVLMELKDIDFRLFSKLIDPTSSLLVCIHNPNMSKSRSKYSENGFFSYIRY